MQLAKFTQTNYPSGKAIPSGASCATSLALAFLVHANQKCVVWRAQVPVAHVEQLDKDGSLDDSKLSMQCGCNSKMLRVTLHAGLAEAGFGGYCAHAPV